MSEHSITKTGIIATVLLLAAAATTDTQNSAAASAKQTSTSNGAFSTNASHGIPCLLDPERGEVPDCLRKSTKGELFVAPQIVKQLDFDTYGLATIRSSEGWMYVNRSGKVVVAGVPVMDNGADSFRTAWFELSGTESTVLRTGGGVL